MQILKLVHASAADVRAASLRVAVDNAKGRVSHEASRLACNHRHARNGMGAAALNGLADVFVDELVSLIPADLFPARILVKALFGIGALHRLRDSVRIVELHNARCALGANVPAPDRAIGVALELNNLSIDHMSQNGALIEAHVACRRNPFVFFLGIPSLCRVAAGRTPRCRSSQARAQGDGSRCRNEAST